MDPKVGGEEEAFDLSLRPRFLADFIGQAPIVANLKTFIEAAKNRNEPLDHVLLPGPPGLGKTTMAHIIANEMGVGIRTTSGPAVERKGDIAAILSYREIEGGQRVIDGFLVTQVKPSGAAERLGLRNGDVILDVNGQVLDGMATVMRLFGELQAAPQVTVTVLRDGRRMSVVFNTR